MFETMIDLPPEHLYGYNFDPPKEAPIYPRQSSLTENHINQRWFYCCSL